VAGFAYLALESQQIQKRIIRLAVPVEDQDKMFEPDLVDLLFLPAEICLVAIEYEIGDNSALDNLRCLQ
jgi:hypothetical protein